MRFGWSLDKSTWRKAATIAPDLGWKRIPFAAVHQSLVPTQPGIYAICTPGLAANDGLFDLLYNVLYVGQTRSLRDRFLQHCRDPHREMARASNCFKSLDFWCAPSAREELDSLEALMIDLFGPPANRQSGIRARIGPPQKI
jgi:excinuclease UvrABC nuclease subunit